jgi:hypothetical protein
VLGALVLAGALLRLWHFLTRGNLWNDEAGLALNFVGRTFSEVARPWISAQIAPYLFVQSEKVVSLVLGESDFALRLLSLVAGIAVLPLTAAVVQRVAGTRAALLSLILLVPAHRLIHFTAELKPYALDACVAALLLWLGQRAARSTRDLHVLGVVGVVAGWFSLPSLFMLAGVGAALAADALLREKNRARLVVLGGYGVFWLASFGLHFKLFLQPVATDSNMHQYYAALDDYAPFPPRSLGDLKWYIGRFFFLFKAPGGYALRYLAGVLWVVGAIDAFRKQRWLALMFVVPWVAVFGASAVHHYILEERVLVFLVPCMTVLIALGVDDLLERPFPALRALGLLLMVAILVAPLRSVGEHFRLRREGPGLADLVERMKREAGPSDGIYIDRATLRCFTFYSGRLGFEHPYATAAADSLDESEHRDAIGSLAGKPKVWALVPSCCGRLPDTLDAIPIIQSTKGKILKRLGELGKPLSTFDGGDSALYLYDLSRPPEPK